VSDSDRTLAATKLRAERDPTSVTSGAGLASGLPQSLVHQASRRLRLVSFAILGVLVFGWLAPNFFEGELVHELTTPIEWGPNVALLTTSLGVIVTLRAFRLSPSAIIAVGLAFQVIVSWCIPISQYWGAFAGVRPEQLTADLVGMSPVAIWMVFFTVIFPARPRDSLVALTLSAASTPVTIAILTRLGEVPALAPREFLFVFAGPYVFALVFAYVAARIIYGLGRDVQRATELGSYRLLDLIGRGGMGEVWKASHHFLARPAAVKLIHTEALGPDHRDLEAVVSRFEREAQVTAALESPHTVALYDFGVSDSGAFYYAMELLDGMDLESLIERFGPLPPERVVHVLRQVCLSLGEAHRKGLVHRDIKPANIFLCERAFEPDFVKVLDFGLVKRSAGAGQSETALATQANVIAGTPAYLAPELAAGKEAADGRADIYSLGCVGFWLLTGRRVFEETTAVALILAHANAVPPVPSELVEQDVPQELDSVILACLAKAPADRPATAEALAERLASTDLVGRWTRERAADWWHRHVGG
jgi:serine/threonine-protein kinase